MYLYFYSSTWSVYFDHHWRFTRLQLCVLCVKIDLKHKIDFLEMQICSLPRGGALRAAAEIKQHLVHKRCFISHFMGKIKSVLILSGIFDLVFILGRKC